MAQIFMIKSKLFLAVAFANSVIVNPSKAQEDEVFTLEEIVVTATRRDTTVLDTPIAITALDEDALRVLNVDDASNLQNVIPGLQVRDNSIDGQGAVDINLRGIGNSNFIETGESNVSFNIDGVYTARPQAMLQLFNDVQRVEVSRGPQGTLSGRNATSGSINVVPNRPDFDAVTGSIELEGTSNSGRGIKAILNLPISDTFALRANLAQFERDSAHNLVRDETDTISSSEGFSGQDGDGNPFTTVSLLNQNPNAGANTPYFESRYSSPEDDGPGSHGSKDFQAFRLSALWEPTESVSWLLSYEGYQNNALGAPLSVDCERADCEQFYSPGQVEQVNRNALTSFVSFKGKMDQEINNFRSVFEWDIENLFKVKYTYGRSELEQTTIQDVDGGAAIELVFLDDPWLNDSDVHDLQFNSNSDGKLNWVFGLFSFKEVSDRRLSISFYPSGWDVFDNPDYTVSTKAAYADITYDLTDKLEFFAGLRHSKDEKSNKGSSRYTLSGDSCVSAVGNSPLNQAEGSVFFHAGVDALLQNECLAADLEAPKSEDDFTDFRLGVNYRYSDSMSLYASVASGHKAKLQDQKILIDKFSPERLIVPTKTEKLINWELGMKGSAFDERLYFTSAFFYVNYQDKQEALTYNFGDRACDLNGNGVLDDDPALGEGALGCGLVSGETFDLENPTDLNDIEFPDQIEYAVVAAPELDIYGLELEAGIDVGDYGNLSGFLTYTKAEYGDFNYSNVVGCPNQNLDNATGGWCSTHNVAGNNPRNTPELTLNLTYSHTFLLDNDSTIVPTFNAYYRSEYFLQPENSKGVDPTLITPSFFADGSFANHSESALYADVQEASIKFNFNITWSSPSDAYKVELYGNNIFDELVRSNMRVDSANTPLYVYEEPANYGIRFKYQFE